MKGQVVLCLLSAFFFSTGYSLEGNVKAEVTYIGAVLEYEPYGVWDDVEKGYKVVKENANIIVNYAAQAKQQLADILVVPEYGLQSLNTFDNDTEKFLTFGQYVPDPADNIIPCNMNISDPSFEGVQILSCGAINNGIYLVIDMEELYPCSNETVALAPWPIQPSENCAPSGYFVYNTQAVFDRTGAVIARYRKIHLFNEDAFTPGPQDDSTALFLTDFDVLFTLQVCFDIAFEHPGYTNIKEVGVRDVAMSTAWIDYLPFDLADNVQNAFSRGLGVNLLVAGYHKPELSKLGSGIYKGYSKELPVYTYDKNSGNVLLVTSVTTLSSSSLVGVPHSEHPKRSSTPLTKKTQSFSLTSGTVKEENRTHVMVHENLSNYSYAILETGAPGNIFTENICDDDNFCCDLTYEYTGNLTYMLLVFSGQFAVSEGRYPVGIQNCAVAWCRTRNINTCALVELGLPADDDFGPFTLRSSSFITDAVYPEGNHRNLSLISNDVLKFEVNGPFDYSLSTSEPIRNHLVASLYGRWYSNDGFSRGI